MNRTKPVSFGLSPKLRHDMTDCWTQGQPRGPSAMVCKVLLPKLMAKQEVPFMNMPKVATGPASPSCHPMCFLAEGFALCLQSAYGISYGKQCPWSLSVHSAGRGHAGSRCSEKESNLWWKIHAEFAWLQINLYFKWQKLFLGMVFSRSWATACFPTCCCKHLKLNFVVGQWERSISTWLFG